LLRGDWGGRIDKRKGSKVGKKQSPRRSSTTQAGDVCTPLSAKGGIKRKQQQRRRNALLDLKRNKAWLRRGGEEERGD